MLAEYAAVRAPRAAVQPRAFAIKCKSSKFNQSNHLEEIMRRMRPLVLCGAAFLGLALGIGAASAEDKTFELKLSHWVPPTHPLQKAIQDWADDIQNASNGTITYKIYPSQQLGK